MSKWQPIETAPHDETRVLVFDVRCRHEAVQIASWNTGAGGVGWLTDGGAEQNDYWNYVIAEHGFSHWMPLPSPPETD